MWGVRVCGLLCGEASVQRAPLTGHLMQTAITAGTQLLLTAVVPVPSLHHNTHLHNRSSRDTTEMTTVTAGTPAGSGRAAAVSSAADTANKHRLVAVSALANLAAALNNCR